jgi:hypothetical protein
MIYQNIFFYILHRLNLFFKIKNAYCFIISLPRTTLHNIVFYFILFNKFYMCVKFYYKLILINKFIKDNRVNN